MLEHPYKRLLPLRPRSPASSPAIFDGTCTITPASPVIFHFANAISHLFDFVLKHTYCQVGVKQLHIVIKIVINVLFQEWRQVINYSQKHSCEIIRYQVPRYRVFKKKIVLFQYKCIQPHSNCIVCSVSSCLPLAGHLLPTYGVQFSSSEGTDKNILRKKHIFWNIIQFHQQCSNALTKPDGHVCEIKIFLYTWCIAEICLTDKLFLKIKCCKNHHHIAPPCLSCQLISILKALLFEILF